MKGTVLIVDDEIHHLQALNDSLEDEYDIYQAMSGIEVLEILEEASVDLIISDWDMPSMSGIELIHKLNENPKLADVPVIMVTARVDVESLNEAFSVGARDYVRKPITEEKIMELKARVNSSIELYKTKQKVEEEKQRADELLYKILPREVVDRQKRTGKTPSQYYEQASILFTDFQGFTNVAAKLTPTVLLKELNECFTVFDKIVVDYNLEKIKTIGDAYMCAGGIPKANKTHSIDTVLAGLKIQNFMTKRYESKIKEEKEYWQCRVGINTGTVIAGVVGEQRFAYDVWGDAVNVASRMESNGAEDKVNISRFTAELVKDFFDLEPIREIEVKGKGTMEACFVIGIKENLATDGTRVIPNETFWELYKSIS